MSPETVHAIATTTSGSDFTGSPVAHRRMTHVCVGPEKVILSAANVLESGLGVDVGDSEDSSFYDDSYEDRPQDPPQKSHPLTTDARERSSGKFSSADLPRLNEANDFDGMDFKFPKREDRATSHMLLDSQSPLCALIGATNDDASGYPEISSNPPDSPRRLHRCRRASHVPHMSTSVVSRLPAATRGYRPAINRGRFHTPTRAASS